MEDEKSKNDNPPAEQAKESGNQETKADTVEATTGGWGGWGFSPFSVLSDLQKAAQEISRSMQASVAAEKAAKSIADIQISEVSESLKEEEETEEPAAEKESDDEDEKRRKSALDKLEKASEESFLGQRLKVIDNSVENLASGAWQALGSAWKGSANFVQKLENSIQQGGLPVAADSVAPSFIETGKALTAKGMQVLEFVGKETMDLLISETGIEVEKNPKDGEQEGYEDQLYEEVTFDRCFYIYGGPEQLEELEALSNHYALLFNRRKAKLSSEQKSVYDGKLKQVQQIFSLSTDVEGSGRESDKGKKVETGTEGSGDEMKNLHDTSVSKAADMAAGFTNALAGQTVNDIIQRTAGRLESLHSEGVHRISEMCCFAISQLLMLGKSIISSTNKVQDEDADTDILNIDWPEDFVEKAKIIRTKAQSMTGFVEAVSSSFITGIADVAEAYQAAMKAVTATSLDASPQTLVQEKVKAFSEHLRSDQTTAVGNIQDGLQYLTYLVLSTSMPSA
ncbi:hypothetical protein WN944_028891 [Citrus x changshan-huyou]|uniref:DUF7798 domain-containing protein n=2 Tax=Citrus TaxID=2706 RepID=A0AAP0LK87_9ROSI